MGKARHGADHTGDGLLLIEGDLVDAKQVLGALTGQGQPHVEWVKCLSDGLQRLREPGIGAILLNLFLPDSAGIETFDKARAAAGQIPILVLCATTMKTSAGWRSNAARTITF